MGEETERERPGGGDASGAFAWPLPEGCDPRCRACAHRRLSPEESAARKEAWIRRALAPWADRVGPIRRADPGRAWGYRRRVRLVAWVLGGAWRFGLGRGEELIPLERCPLHHPSVGRLADRLRRALPPDPAALPLAFLTLTGAQACLVLRAREGEVRMPPLPEEFLEGTGVEGLWAHFHPCAGRRIFGRGAWRLLRGVPESRNELGMLYGPASFQQVLLELYARSLEEAEAHLEPGPGRGVADLYCGDGTSLARWRLRGAEALGVEIVGDALARAARNAPGSALLRGACGLRAPQIAEWLSGFPPSERRAYLNPPRTGLEPPVGELLRRLPVGRAAYLSCAAGTLRRDLESLEAGGYRVVRLSPYDFFPRTDHAETLALLEGPREGISPSSAAGPAPGRSR